MKKCVKCGFESEENLERNGFLLCTFCSMFSPSEESLFRDYLNEKVDGALLETFRKNFKPAGEKQKRGMLIKASEGSVMSRAPFGYIIQEGKLVPAQNSKEIEEIFEDFLKNKISLRKLASKHNLSVNGLKKVLSNFTYIGKVRFNNQIHDGTHPPIISSTLFNHVQNKLEMLRKK